MAEGRWVTKIRATYARDDRERAKELTAQLLDRGDAVAVIWRRGTASILVDYGTDSKYGPVRPAASALHDIFDPIADSEYYEPWPERLTLETKWVEGPESHGARSS